MKVISWNIDSLNAALTSDSARAQLSQAVLQTLQAENADIIAIQETKLSATGPTKKHLAFLPRASPQRLCRDHVPLQKRAITNRHLPRNWRSINHGCRRSYHYAGI